MRHSFCLYVHYLKMAVAEERSLEVAVITYQHRSKFWMWSIEDGYSPVGV